MEAALKFLSRTERFEGEVRKHLSTFDHSEVDTLIESLKLRNIINDERAIQSYLRVHTGRKGAGLFKMEAELRSKGVSDQTISLLAEMVSEPDTALDALSGKFQPKEELKPKMFRFLVSRGFSYDSAHSAIRKFLSSGV